MNNICIIGNLTRDPEIRTTSGGKTLCKVGVAVSRRRQKEITDFFNVVIWGQAGQYLADYARKGDKVSIAGSMQNDAYEKDGSKKDFWQVNANEVSILSPKGGGGYQPAGGRSQDSANVPEDFDPFAED